jgi:very-short-patch-repair endonuclease
MGDQAVIERDKAPPELDVGHSCPSPLEGEGASRSEAGEGTINRRHKEWRTTRTPLLRARAKSMRHVPTDAERTLWGILRNRTFAGFKFRRQVPVGNYIVDFLCPTANLIIELDGSQHAENERDLVRQRWLEARGYSVLRVWNVDLFANRESTRDAIWHALHSAPHPSRPAADPPSPSRGEGSQRFASPPALDVGHRPSPLEGEGASRSEAGEGTNRPNGDVS